MTRARRVPLFVVPLAVCALALSACGGTGGEANNVQVRQQGTIDINEVPADKVKEGGTFNFPITGVIEQYNYSHIQGTSGDLSDVGRTIFAEPFTAQSDGTVAPNKNYVESAELVSAEPQVVQLKINPKAKWSNGTPITWKDFEVNIAATSGKLPGYEPTSSTGSEDVSKVERGATDQEVKITFAKKFADWKSIFGFLYPASEIDTPEKFNTGWIGKIPVTGGPFKVKNIDNTAKTITVERDPNWWGDKPKLNAIVFKVATQEAAPQAFQSGALDMIDIGPSVSGFQTVSQIPDVVVRKALAPNWRVVNVGYREGSPLRDLKVRQAVFKGIDRTIIAKTAVGPIVPDVTPLQNHIFVGGQQGYQDNGAEYSYDKADAIKLLDEAGWKLNEATKVREKDGKPLELQWIVPAGTKVSADEAQVAQKQLGEIGIKINIETVDSDAWQNQYLTVGNFDFLNMSWLGTPFPISSTKSIYTFDPANPQQNYGKVPDTEGLAELYRQANEELDDQKRIALGDQIDKAIWKEAFSIPLYQRPDAVGVRKNVVNFGAFGFAQPDWTKVGFAA